MSTSSLERARSMQEDIEYYERAVVHILNEKTRNHRERILQGHRVSKLLDRVVEQSGNVLDIYNDVDGIMKNEVEAMGGDNMFSSFYDSLKAARDFHRKYPKTTVQTEPDMKDCINPEIQFSGEERFGKYVDLHEFYTRFLNLEPVKQSLGVIEYLKYLDTFSHFETLKQAKKIQSQEYKTYLSDLMHYLKEFYCRTQPLVDLDDVLQETLSKFDQDWQENRVKGWAYSPLYCRACNKLFASEGVFNSHLNGKKHKKALEQMENATVDQAKEIASLEVQIRKLCELLSEVVSATKAYLEMKQTRTPEELQAEIEEEELGAVADIDMDEDDDDDESPLYNPLNLPLGWDGKPIPYWLYKLHGLGTEFKCEICGNHSYWGRRAFDRHFQEWRHAHGMRCLNIPNTKHFHDIVLIEDAINLYSKIKDQIVAETWRAGDEEEFEDSQGNVMSRKTYQDLARQGLL